MKLIDSATTILKGAAGIAGIEAVESMTNTLVETSVQIATDSAQVAAETAQTITADFNNPVAIIDAVIKAIVALVTVWQLIRKPKPKI